MINAKPLEDCLFSPLSYFLETWQTLSFAKQIVQNGWGCSKDEKKSTQKPKHVAIFKKEQIIGVDGVMDLEDVNQFSEMSLFTNFQENIKNIEKSIPQTTLSWVHHD